MLSCTICNTPLTGTKTKFCSRICQNQSTNHKHQNYAAQQQRGLSRKIDAIKLLGNSCSVCGYNKNVSALEFHHIDPSTKKFGLDLRVFSNNSLISLRLEISKCMLVCSNCHREIENPRLNDMLTVTC